MKKRYYGIDLLKGLAMFMVVILHLVTYSEGISNEIEGSLFSKPHGF